MMRDIEYKQVIVLRKDLKMPPGKAIAQGCHACVEAVLKSDNFMVNEWRKQGMKKVVLKVDSEKDLLSFFEKAKHKGLKSSLITDAGRTFFKESVKTGIAIGPDEDEKVDWITKELKLY